MLAALRSLLVLGRVSNLPTVWSNCLAGWLLAGGKLAFSLPLLALCAGCSLLYVGGMYLNDACDVAFDAAHRPERPIPAGSIQQRTVTILGIGWLLAGAAALQLVAPAAFVWTLALATLIIVYDLFHKQFAWAPVLMAGCRVVIYPIAAAAAATQFPEWERDPFFGCPLVYQAALAMGAWIVTLTVLARTEAVPGPIRKWVFLLLLLPFVLGVGTHRAAALFPAVMLLFWLFRCWLYFRAARRIGPVVGDLIAAIPLVDALLVSPPTPLECLPYLAFLGLALLLRRSIPAT